MYATINLNWDDQEAGDRHFTPIALKVINTVIKILNSTLHIYRTINKICVLTVLLDRKRTVFVWCSSECPLQTGFKQQSNVLVLF